MSGTEAAGTGQEACWRVVTVPAGTDPTTATERDVAYASGIGLASRTAWTSYITQERNPPAEINLGMADIGFNGGYPIDYDWLDNLGGTALASAWPVTDRAEAEAVVADLSRGGLAEWDGHLLELLLAELTEQPNAVVIASREIGSRRANAILAYTRNLTVHDGEVSYDVHPHLLVAPKSGHARPALLACFAMQAKSDFEAAIMSMSKASDVRPIASFCHGAVDVPESLVIELSDRIDYAQDGLFDGEELPSDVDFGSVVLSRTATTFQGHTPTP